MRVLVTGASGYAGFHAAIALRASGHNVSGLVRRNDTPTAVDLQKNEVRLVTSNLAEPDSYRTALEQSDVIIHTVLDPQDPIKTDQIFLQTLAEVAANAPRKPLLIYTTGCSIYGKLSQFVMDENTIGNPNAPLAFRMEQEKAVLAMTGIKRVIVRPGFMYGKTGNSSMSGRWFQAGITANQTGKATYYGDPQKHWSWVHIEDLARAYVQIAESNACIDGEIFCLADEQRVKNLELMTACVRMAGFNGEIEIAPADRGDWFDVASDQNELITSLKAAQMLNWSPKHTGILDDLDTYYQSWLAAQL